MELTLTQIQKLRKGRAVPFAKLQCGVKYRVVGIFHQRVHTAWVPAHGAIVGVYEGQVSGDPTRHIFLDMGTTYVVSDTAVSHGGAVTARLYKLKEHTG